MATLDFEVEIGLPSAEGSYPVFARAAWKADGTLRWSWTPADFNRQLAVIQDNVLASSTPVRRAATEDEQPVRELGQRLFEALIADDVRDLYEDSKRRAREDGGGLRLVLRVRPPELARLPWEFLFDPGRQDYLGLDMPLVRYPQVLAPQQPLRVAAPLRILGMVALPTTSHLWTATPSAPSIWAMLTCNPVRSMRRRGWSATRPGLLRRLIRHGW